MNIITHYYTESNSKTEKTEGNAGNKLLKTGKITSETEKFTNESRKNAFKKGVSGVYPFVHFYPSKTFSLHLFGVKFDYLFDSKPTNHGNAFNGETETMSKSSRVRLLKKTSALELLGEKPTHMLTLTLPPERFEALTNSEKISTWNFAKSFFLRKLSKILVSRGKNKALWFQEFQERGAPHLHVYLGLGKLNKTEWEEYLKRFIAIWKKALKWNNENFPTQSVHFEGLKKPDFRYARKYASKLKQKNAPFLGKWGKWWGTTGEWRLIKGDKELDIELSSETVKGIFAIRENMNWIVWDWIETLNEELYKKILFELLNNRTRTKEKWSMNRVKANLLSREMEELLKERNELKEQRINEATNEKETRLKNLVVISELSKKRETLRI